MRARDLRAKSRGELDQLMTDLLKEQFNLRMQKGSGQLGQPSRFRQIRRDIARIETVLNEQERGGEA